LPTLQDLQSSLAKRKRKKKKDNIADFEKGDFVPFCIMKRETQRGPNFPASLCAKEVKSRKKRGKMLPKWLSVAKKGIFFTFFRFFWLFLLNSTCFFLRKNI